MTDCNLDKALYKFHHRPNVELGVRIPDSTFFDSRKLHRLTNQYLLYCYEIHKIIIISLNVILIGKGDILSFTGQYIIVWKESLKNSVTTQE